jgi:hypothetical protein
MTFQAADTLATQHVREWSSPMCAFPVSGQPPTVIFCVRSITRAADRTPQQRLGMQQRPEARCQAALAAVGRGRAVAGAGGMPGWPDPRLNHLFSFTCQWRRFVG